MGNKKNINRIFKNMKKKLKRMSKLQKERRLRLIIALDHQRRQRKLEYLAENISLMQPDVNKIFGISTDIAPHMM